MRFAVRFVRNWRWRLLLVILSILSSMIIHLSIFPSFHEVFCLLYTEVYNIGKYDVKY